MGEATADITILSSATIKQIFNLLFSIILIFLIKKYIVIYINGRIVSRYAKMQIYKKIMIISNYKKNIVPCQPFYYKDAGPLTPKKTTKC